MIKKMENFRVFSRLIEDISFDIVKGESWP